VPKGPFYCRIYKVGFRNNWFVLVPPQEKCTNALL
jgi:hypothetical protein